MFEELFGNWSNELIYLARITYAGILGIALGYERMLREKEAGIRTHFVVAMGSALMMILSKYAFSDMLGNTDGARIAAQVVSGIGFLGAGMIIYRREALHGLTTAAGIWVTAGVGMAAGAGLYIVALGACAVAILVQVLLHLNNIRFTAKRFTLISVKFVYSDETVSYLKKTFDALSFTRFNAYEENGIIVADAVIRTSKNCFAEQLVKTMLDNKDVISIKRINDD